MDKILFKETQGNIILVIIAVVLAIFFGVFVILQVVLGKPVGNHPAPNGLLIGFLAICI